MVRQRIGYQHKSHPERNDFFALIDEAILDMTEHGYDSQSRLDNWLKRLQEAAHAVLIPERTLSDQLKRVLAQTFIRETGDAVLQRRHPGISRFTLAAIKPKLRAELDRRLLASAGLIRLNRTASIERTLQRFAGWASSIPIGGVRQPENKRILAQSIGKDIKGLPFIERRVVIDQGHKLVSAVNDIVAVDGGAIAGEWHSHYKEAGYDYRPEHKARDARIYLIRGSWADQKEYVRKSGVSYTDDITAPGEEVYCRCFYRYIYNLREIPETLLSKKGRDALKAAREHLAW